MSRITNNISDATIEAGTLDPSFGDGGVVMPPAGTRSIAVLPDKKVIVFTGASLQEPITLARLTEKGQLIAVLNPDGGLNLIFNKGQPLYAAFLQNLVFLTLLFQQGRKILVTGSGGEGYLMAARYELDGSPDPKFGNKGWIILNPREKLTALSNELTADNKIVALGKSGVQMYVVRYLG